MLQLMLVPLLPTPIIATTHLLTLDTGATATAAPMDLPTTPSNPPHILARPRQPSHPQHRACHLDPSDEPLRVERDPGFFCLECGCSYDLMCCGALLSLFLQR
jgi:hypothetical protein